MDTAHGDGQDARSPWPVVPARVWDALFVSADESGQALQQLQATSRALGDAQTEGVAVALLCFETVVTRPDGESLPALARARDTVLRLGSQRGAWLCDDLEAVVHLRHGRHDEARQRLLRNADLPKAARGAGEWAFTWWQLGVLHQEALDYEAGLEAGHAMLAAANEGGLQAFAGVAWTALAALHVVVLDFAEGVELQDVAARHLAAAGAQRMLPTCHANRVFTHYASGSPARAAQARQDWLDSGVGQGKESNRVALALGALAAGELDAAEALLGEVPPPSALSRHHDCAWHWVRARLLLARDQPAAAAALCRSWLARGPEAKADTPLNLAQLQEALRDAAEACGDLRGALEAAKAVRAVELPQLALHARVRYRALRLQLREPGAAANPQTDQRRLLAVEQAISLHKHHLEVDAEPVAVVDAAQSATRRFVAQVSHEIRTPLTGVMGFTELLLRSELDGQQRRLVELARTSADAMMRLLNDILDMARLEAGRFKLEPQAFSLRELLQELVAMMGPLAREQGLEFGFVLDPRVPRVVHGDALRLRQVLGNLLGNALKFTPQGGITLRVQGRAGADPQAGALRIEVADTGRGIPTELRDRLFTEFSKGAGSSGSGLGLAISRQLVQRMGGDIGVEDRPGGGSVFWLTLDLPAAAEAPATPA